MLYLKPSEKIKIKIIKNIHNSLYLVEIKGFILKAKITSPPATNTNSFDAVVLDPGGYLKPPIIKILRKDEYTKSDL